MTAVVKLTEVYDLSTTKGKMGMICIRTPTSGALRNQWQGLWDNHRFVRILKCDVALACASVLPTDPLSVGVTEGDMAPQDMFNPLLYKTVSNESMEALVQRCYGLSAGGNTGIEQIPPSTVNEFDPVLANASFDNWTVYYSQLASKGWRKAMPQSGFNMRNVRPFVYQVLNTVGNQLLPSSSSSMNTVPYNSYAQYSGTVNNNTTGSVTFRGRPVPMPRLPTKYLSSNNNAVGDVSIPQFPVVAIITPPARLHELYFRLRVTWTVRFEKVVSFADYQFPVDLQDIGAQVYGTDFEFPTKDHETNSVDSVATSDVNLERVM